MIFSDENFTVRSLPINSGIHMNHIMNHTTPERNTFRRNAKFKSERNGQNRRTLTPKSERNAGTKIQIGTRSETSLMTSESFGELELFLTSRWPPRWLAYLYIYRTSVDVKKRVCIHKTKTACAMFW